MTRALHILWKPKVWFRTHQAKLCGGRIGTSFLPNLARKECTKNVTGFPRNRRAGSGGAAANAEAAARTAEAPAAFPTVTILASITVCE